MERKTFELIEAICREGLTNDVWGVFENGNTGDWFGDKEPHELHGQYLYVYNVADDRQDELLKAIKPDLVIHDKYGTCINLYELV